MESVEQLRAAVVSHKLVASDEAFATDLIKHFDKRASLSDRQFFWVNKLVLRAAGGLPPSPTTSTLASSVARVFRLFATAKANGLRYPKIRLQTPDGSVVVFTQAGEKSKYTGQVQITDGQSYGQNRYYGRIDQAGALTEGRDLIPAVRDLINELAADPEGVASIHGHRTGDCCFCRTALTDQRSIAVGYGPVCAKKFGLSWGKEAEATQHFELQVAS